jgi:hypothetical protein
MATKQNFGVRSKRFKVYRICIYVLNFNTNKRKKDRIHKFVEIQTLRKEFIPTNSIHSCLSVTIYMAYNL